MQRERQRRFVLLNTINIIILVLLLSCGVAFAQPSTQTTFSVSDDDTTVWNPWQLSFPGTSVTDDGDGTASINIAGLVTALCTSGVINCVYDTLADCPNPFRCVVYEDNMWKQYANGELQAQWPIEPIEPSEFFLLLDDGATGFTLLLDDGAGGYSLIIE